MTTYDFSTCPNRKGQHSLKWRSSEVDNDLLQLWVADMDFQPFPELRAALRDYADQHVFGYTYASEGVYQAILDWEKNQHGYLIDKDAILLIEGVVPAVSVAIQALTAIGDAVMIHTPAYPPFARTISLNQRRLICQSLKEEQGLFTIDFQAFEATIVAKDVKLYLFCNPHNPGGRVWSKEEIAELGRICQRHGVLVVSDEIHQDLTLYGHRHHSFNTVDPSFKDFSMVLSSASKTFNIAGTKNSFALIEDAGIRKRFERRQLANNQHEIATVGLLATEVAFTKGQEWLIALRQVIEENCNFVTSYLTQHTRITVMKPQATYLMWLDFSAYELEHVQLQSLLREKAKLVLNDGLTFGKEGLHHARLNLATPLSVLAEACERLAAVLQDLEKD